MEFVMSEDNDNLEFLVGKAIQGDLHWEPVLMDYTQEEVVDCLLDEEKCLKSKALMQRSAIEEMAEALDIWQLCRLFLKSDTLGTYVDDLSVFEVVSESLFFKADRFGQLPLDERVAFYKRLTETDAPIHSGVPGLLWDMSERLPWSGDVRYLVVAVNSLTNDHGGSCLLDVDWRETVYGSYRALRHFLPQTA